MSRATTVNVAGLPAVTLEARLYSPSVPRLAGLIEIRPSVPVTPGALVSVAVRDYVPVVLSAALKMWEPLSEATKV